MQVAVHATIPLTPCHLTKPQVKADRIIETGVDLEKLGILAAVRSGLAPWASKVHATLDKLNLYSKGGVSVRTLKAEE